MEQRYQDQQTTNGTAAATGPTDAASTRANKTRSKKCTSAKKEAPKKKKSMKYMQIGSRVKLMRMYLIHRLKTPEQRACAPPSLRNNAWFYGTIKSGSGRSRFTVKFDALPLKQQEIAGIDRVQLKLHKDKEELLYDPQAEEEYELEKRFNEEKAKSPENLSVKKFLEKSNEEIKEATSFTYHLDKNDLSKKIDWKIHANREFINDCPIYEKLKEKTKPQFKKQIDRKKSIADNFFDLVLFDLKGTAKILDKYLNDTRCSMHLTYVGDKIKFHDETNEDPDWKIKRCILVLIAAAGENEKGVEALWASGKGEGRKLKPDFGKYVAQNEMKCFLNGAAYMFADEDYWYTPKGDKPWEMFLNTIQKFNDRRKQLLVAYLLMLDESMVGWKPKVSQYGSLPNITFEKRKTDPLGTMLRG